MSDGGRVMCPVPPSHGAFHAANSNYEFDL